jgi:hypothetical protein
MRNGKILRVWIEQVTDTDPDTSDLGTYSNHPGPDDRTIDREHDGSCGRNEYRYFIAAMSGEETGNPESVRQDYDRMESFSRGDWGYIGIIAKAELQLTRNGTIQILRSGGLWGVESDSGNDYLQEVADEELETLRRELSAIGFSTEQIERAFDGVGHKDA